MPYLKQIIQTAISFSWVITFFIGFFFTKIGNIVWDFFSRHLKYYSIGKRIYKAQEIVEKDDEIDKVFRAYNKQKTITKSKKKK
jgi:hypothetical protein